MERREEILACLEPILEVLANQLPEGAAADRLNVDLGLEHPAVVKLGALVREGAEAGWICPKGGPGMRFGRIARPSPETLGFSVDAVVMDRPGPGHVHPKGEFDLCFALSGTPRFDGRVPGWTVYPEGSWHIPTVSGGEMVILYFLPEGAFEMAAQPPE